MPKKSGASARNTVEKRVNLSLLCNAAPQSARQLGGHRLPIDLGENLNRASMRGGKFESENDGTKFYYNPFY